MSISRYLVFVQLFQLGLRRHALNLTIGMLSTAPCLSQNELYDDKILAMHLFVELVAICCGLNRRMSDAVERTIEPADFV